MPGSNLVKHRWPGVVSMVFFILPMRCILGSPRFWEFSSSRISPVFVGTGFPLSLPLFWLFAFPRAHIYFTPSLGGGGEEAGVLVASGIGQVAGGRWVCRLPVGFGRRPEAVLPSAS